MRKVILRLLKTTSKPFIGKGFIDKHFHFLIPVFEFFYTLLQKREKIIVKLPLDLRLKVFSDDPGVGMSLISRGSFEPALTNIFLKTLRSDQVFLDIGANYGYYTILASKLVGKSGRVFAFEPDPENIELLQENIDLNNCTNVAIEQKAVSEKNGKIFFESQKFNKGESAISRGSSGISVESIALDSFGTKRDIRRVDVLKIDVEGAEIGVLKGAKKLISESRELTLFIEYNPSRIEYYGGKPQELMTLLSELGFQILNIADESKGIKLSFSLSNLEETLKHTTYCNLICFKV
ncbi:MAG: Methyltransferase FkbM [Candidatus Levybacteria bacterium GW2011_GWA2_40_8]|nr:MAG: Methyltransferase FkbM [Candidatus Levybacteria bacterium GW2011_GWA2_40_8]